MGKGRNKRELKMKLLFLSFLGLSMAGTKCSGDMCWARGPRPRKPQGGKNEAECSIDAHETNPESWNMNCPDSCEIMEFLDVVEKESPKNGQWSRAILRSMWTSREWAT